jgi:urea carboxylase system permease
MPGRGTDSADLEDFGYRQQLDRGLGAFGAFSASFSFTSVMTGVFGLFYFGFGFGGPAFIWSWPIVCGVMLLNALLFAELAAQYPIAGSVYNWTKRIGAPFTGWLAGILMIMCAIVYMASVAIDLQEFLPSVSSVFQVIGNGQGTYDFAENAVLIGGIWILGATIINGSGVRWMSRVNSLGVSIELTALTVLIILLVANITRGPAVVFDTHYAGVSTGVGLGYVGGAFLAAALGSAYTPGGFDSASSLAEETHDPRRKGPWAIIQSHLAVCIAGGFLMFFALLSIPDLGAKEIGLPTGGFPFVVKQVLGNTMGTVFVVCACVAATVCVLALQTAATRLIFGMARDNALPGSRKLARIAERSKAPILPAVVVGLIAFALLIVNIRQPAIIAVLASLSVALMYVSYLCVTVSMLIARLRRAWPLAGAGEEAISLGRAGERYFSLGRLGLPLNWLAVVGGIAVTVDVLWPRAAVFNATPPYHWYLRWGGVLFMVAVFALGAVYYFGFRHKKLEVLADHRSPAAAIETTADPVALLGSDID